MSVTTMPRAEAQAEEAPPQKKSKKKALIGVALVMAVTGGAYWFLLKPAPAKEEAPDPGTVVVLEPIQVNLAAGHYLKIGIALQATADAHEDPDGSKALDSTIELFSGLPMEKLSQPVQRDRLKEKLMHDLEERYHGEVMDVYFTEFVTQ